MAKEEYDKFWSPAFDNMGDFVCFIDNDYNLVRVNKSFSEFIGKGEKDLSGKKCYEIFHSSDKPFPSCPHGKMLSTKVCEKLEFFEPWLKRYLSVTATPVWSDDQKLIGSIHITRDITERKLAEKTLRESKAKAKFFKEYSDNILANVPISVLVVNRSGQIVFANRNFLSKMRLNEVNVIGSALSKVVPADIMTKANLHRQISEVIKTRDIVAGQRVDYRGRAFMYHLIPIQEAVGRRHNVAIMMEDVTERVSMEEQLRHSERLAMMGQFAAGVTHEINNPLSIIKGNVQYLREQIGKGADFRKRAEFKELKDTLAAVEQEATRCSEIVNKLLHFAKKSDAKQKGDVDVNHLVRHVFHLMENQLRLKKIKVARELTPRIAKIRGNHDLLQQVVMNLVLNAEQSIPKRGGVITIKTLQDRRKVYIVVKDNGCGIPKEIQQFIFNPFFTTRGGGTGLGLSVAHSIVEDHGGRITVKSTPKRGSVFTVALPLTRI